MNMNIQKHFITKILITKEADKTKVIIKEQEEAAIGYRRPEPSNRYLQKGR